MRRLDDAGKWARGSGAGLTIFGTIAAVATVGALFAEYAWLAANYVVAAVAGLLPGTLLWRYGKRIGARVIVRGLRAANFFMVYRRCNGGGFSARMRDLVPRFA